MLLDLEIKDKIRRGLISSFSSTFDDRIALLSYADYVFITAKATVSNCLELVDSFQKFRENTGLSINLAKSSFMISPNTYPSIKAAITDCLKFGGAKSIWKHLGIPMNGKRLHIEDFNELITKVSNTLSGWRAKLLSAVGKVILLKSTIFSIPLY